MRRKKRKEQKGMEGSERKGKGSGVDKGARGPAPNPNK